MLIIIIKKGRKIIIKIKTGYKVNYYYYPL